MAMGWGNTVEQLKSKAITFAKGLTTNEIESVETRFGFRFPPDLRAFLQTALPIGKQFPDWRTNDENILRPWLDAPRNGICFDIEYNNFWLPEWGAMPDMLEEKLLVATKFIAQAPVLIPVFIHRMMPAEPHLEGNPVLSVHQTDIIYYGYDLKNYFAEEFDIPNNSVRSANASRRRFWDDLVFFHH